MNTLSWALYFADVAGSLGQLFGLITLTGTILTGFFSVVSSAVKERFVPPPVSLCAALLVCALLASVIPSKNTVYAIAASELGQAAVESRIGQKATQAIEAWIDGQISSSKEKAK